MMDELDGSPIKLTGVCGTKAYMAPEVISWEAGGDYMGDKVDMFACGVILYNLVCGKMPF